MYSWTELNKHLYLLCVYVVSPVVVTCVHVVVEQYESFNIQVVI